MMIIFFPSFFREFDMFSIENSKIISNFGPLQRTSHITKHVSKAGKVDQGDLGKSYGSCSSCSEEKSPMVRFPDPKQY